MGKRRNRKIVKRIGKYALVIIVADFVIASVGLYLADSTGDPPLYYEEIKPGVPGRIKEAFKDYVGELHLKQFFSTDIKHLIKKITYKEPMKAPVRERVVQDEKMMSATVALQGFRLRYLDNAHRIKLMQAGVDGIETGEAAGVVRAKATAAFEGGDWSRIDGMEYEITSRGIKGGGAAVFAHGCESLELKGGRATGELVVDLEEAGLGTYENIGIFLRGFEFDTGDKIPDGLNIKGLSVKISPAERTAGKYVANVVAELKGGEVAFREGPGYFYGTSARVLYTVVGMNGGALKRADCHYMMLNRERAVEKVMRVDADLKAGCGCFIPVVQGFEFNIHSTKARFIREVSLVLKNAEYDEKTGKASVLCDGYLSNDGTLPGALDVRFSADLLMIGLPEGAALSESVTCDGEMVDVTEVKTTPVEFHV